MKKEIDKERAQHALDLARDLIRQLIADGNDPSVVYSVFAIGCALSAHAHSIKEEFYLEGCRAIYQDLEPFFGELQ